METTAREYPMTQTPEQTAFSSGDARVTALRNRPELARAVAARRARLRQADREYAIGLATVRNAAQLTQAELATVLGVGQAAVAKMERRPDLLLSTLRSYINGAGGHARLVVDFADGGRRVELDLDTIQGPEQEDAPADEQSTKN
jgi:Helix-turn-helix domain